MLQKQKFSTEVGGKTLTYEISDLAGQANAAVLTRYGETVALTTVVMSKQDSSANYMPLKVDYEERFYAAGKIIGSRFIRREGRPSDDAILAGRLVDRTIRPLFNSRLRRDIQVVVTILQVDDEHEPEFVGLMGASLALAISDAPWGGPVAGVRVAQIGGKLFVNPTHTEVRVGGATFDSFIAGVTGRINMMELAGDDAAEGSIIEGCRRAQEEIDALVLFESEIVRKIGKKKAVVRLSEPDQALAATVAEFLARKLEEAVYQPTKEAHMSKLGELKDAMFAHLEEKFPGADMQPADFLFEEAINNIVHKNVLEKERRPDGRKLDEVRTLNGEVALFPRTHGSALFIRGNTQALGITTLAPTSAEQIIETMEADEKRRFMLHYNFPHFSVGEVGSSRGPGRREIGHGVLARKAIEPLIPPKEAFPYTIRVVSEILSSNGSSSMATVCASVLSLMDAGVPIKKPAAGIAMGLMIGQESGVKGQEYKILTDIQGPEDHHGDMDFKVAGTKDGVNAVQMDVKVDGVPIEIIEETLAQGREARLQILAFMKTLIAEPRAKISPFAPKIRTLKINPEKIGALIGPGGKVINGLIAKYALESIDVEENGDVFIFSDKEENADAAMAEVRAITKEFKVGEVVEGTVVRLLDFGAIVDLGGGKDGMVHVSELKDGFVKQASDVLKLGDFVKAKIVRVEDDRIGLSIKQLKEIGG